MVEPIAPDPVGSLRAACAWVAGRSRHVQVAAELVPEYAASLPAPPPIAGRLLATPAAREAAAAYWLTLDAINFGSGWFPTLRKPSGRTGYGTVSEGLRRRFDRQGPWTAAELCELSATEIAATLGQDPQHELMALFATSLHDVGRHLQSEHAGFFLGPARNACGSAVSLVRTLAGWSSFADVCAYRGRRLAFLKRAQIAAADLARAGAARFDDLARLTMFADNLVPHVLRLDGILRFEPALVERIERGELIEAGSEEEVEIRACAVHAVELIVAASATPRMAAAVDQLLWQRGQAPRYKAVSRHRTRGTAY